MILSLIHICPSVFYFFSFSAGEKRNYWVHAPVSYTHLDVYKRQGLECIYYVTVREMLLLCQLTGYL